MEDTTIIDDKTVDTQVKTFTQEEVDKIIADRVARERKSFDKKHGETIADYEKRIKTANMTAEQKYKFELEEREKAIAEKETAIKNLTVQGLKKSILSKYKVDEKHMKYIAGDTEEEIEANTKEYLEAIGEHWKGQAGGTPSKMTGGSQGSHKEITYDDFKKMSKAERKNVPTEVLNKILNS